MLSKFLFSVLVYLLALLRLSCLYLCTQVSYITFNIDLILQEEKMLVSAECISLYMSLIILWLLLLSECEKEHVLLFIIRTELNIGNVFVHGLLQYSGSPCFGIIISRVISAILSFYIFYISLRPATCILCLIIFQI